MSIFDSIKKYPGSWVVTKSTPLATELGELADEVVSMEVIPSEYGISVEFKFKGGYTQYIPVSTQCDLEIGDSPKVEDLVVLTLDRIGDETIYRIDKK